MRRVGRSAVGSGSAACARAGASFLILTPNLASCCCAMTPGSGIKSGMKSGSEFRPSRNYPTWPQVEVALGDKVIEAVIVAVKAAKADLADYRRFRPAWVAQASERGLAAWIHDRLWYHITVALSDLPQVTITDKGVLREFTVGPETDVYRFRVKRTHMDGDVSTYPTQLALEFLAQMDEMFDGFDELHLIVGYRWDRDERAMGSAVISLRDGRDDIKWEQDLEDPGDDASGADRIPAIPEPSAPVIDGIARDADKASEET